MAILKRYSLFAALIALYFGHFFVPLFSTGPLAAHQVTSISWLNGPNIYQYHYMSIGLLPIILSGLLLHLLGWSTAMRRYSSESVQKVLMYSLATVFAATITLKSELHTVRQIFMFIELMLGFYSLDTIQHYMKRTEVMQSPITFLLALNVIGAGAQSMSDGLISGWAGYALIALTSLFSFGVLHRKLLVDFETFDVLSNTRFSTSRKMKMMLSGIMPAIYAAFILMMVNILMLRFVNEEFALLATLTITPFVTLFFTKQITALQFNASKLEEMSHDLRIYPVTNDVKAFYQQFIKKCDMHTGCSLALLLALGFYADSLIGAHTVIIGGVGWLLIWSALDDLTKQYRNLRERGAICSKITP